jgi:hypothetical protein
MYAERPKYRFEVIKKIFLEQILSAICLFKSADIHLSPMGILMGIMGIPWETQLGLGTRAG